MVQLKTTTSVPQHTSLHLSMSVSPRTSPRNSPRHKNDPPPPIQDTLMQELYHILKNPLRCEKLMARMIQTPENGGEIAHKENNSPKKHQNTTEDSLLDEDIEHLEIVPPAPKSPAPASPARSTLHTSSLFTSKGHISTSNLLHIISKFLILKNPIQTTFRLKRDAIQMAIELIEVYGVLEMVQKGQLFQESRNTMVKFSRRTIRIVVVGGGFAGRKLLRNLEAKLTKFPHNVELILVAAKEYFESLPSIPSLLRDYANLTKIRAPYDRYFKKTRVIVQPLEKIISDDCIQLADGEIISDIDYLILCTGSRYDMSLIPCQEPQNATLVNCADASDVVRNYKRIHEAKSIAVIGGGPVGLEMAGEIAVKYPEKTLHIVSSREILLERCCKAAHKNVKKFFKSFKNCHLQLGCHVKEVTSTHVVTVDGRQLEADVVLACIGFTPQTCFRDTWDPNAFDKRGQVKVNEFFQVEGHPTVFAIGDICNIVEEKLAQVSEKHADLLTKNLVCLETNVAMRAYRPKTRPIFVSLGPKHSIFIHGELVLYEGLIMALVKHLIEYKMMK